MNRWSYIALTVSCVSFAAVADERADYNRRSAERYTAMFQLADINKDSVVSREEARGIIELQARFNDIDIDRDGNITQAELARYIEVTFR